MLLKSRRTWRRTKQRKESAATAAKEKEAKKKKEEEEKAAKKAQLLPELTALMLPFETGTGRTDDLTSLSNEQLRYILKYYFDAMPKGLSQMKKDALVAEVVLRIVPLGATEEAAMPADDMDVSN